MTTNDVDWDYLLDTRLLHISGLTLPLSPSTHALLLEAVRRAKEAGVKVSFDMNYRVRLWSTEKAVETVKPLLQMVDVLFFGRSDAKRLFGFNGSNQEIIEQLRSVTTAAYVVTTLSREGLIAWDGESYHQVPAREVTILDRIGAGDALVGGVLHGYLQGDFVKGLRYGVTCAAMALSQYGDQLVTNKEELEGLIEVDTADITR